MRHEMEEKIGTFTCVVLLFHVNPIRWSAYEDPVFTFLPHPTTNTWTYYLSPSSDCSLKIFFFHFFTLKTICSK